MYTLILKNEKIISYNRLGLFILLIHLLYFTGYLLKVNLNVNFPALIAGMVVSGVGFAFNITSALKNKTQLIPFFLVLIAVAIVWAVLGNYWLFAAMIILAFLDFNVRKKPTVYFSNDGIGMNVFPKKTYQWQQMGNVVLKDRILTLDFKDDRLIQSEIDGESYGIDEGGFNLFCNRHLNNEE